MDREERKAEYLNCFIRTFAENGIDRTPVKKLASAAKINEASIYQYFKNKDEIVVDCVKLYLEGEMEKMLRILSDERKSYESRIRQVLKISAETAEESRFIIQVLTSPMYGKLCSPLLRSFSQQFLSFCGRPKGRRAFSREPITPAEALLILSTIISYRVLGDENLFRMQIEYLLDLFCGKKEEEEPQLAAVQRLGLNLFQG